MWSGLWRGVRRRFTGEKVGDGVGVVRGAGRDQAVTGQPGRGLGGAGFQGPQGGGGGDGGGAFFETPQGQVDFVVEGLQVGGVQPLAFGVPEPVGQQGHDGHDQDGGGGGERGVEGVALHGCKTLASAARR